MFAEPPQSDLDAGDLLVQLQAIAECAQAEGAPPELMSAAQERASALHARRLALIDQQREAEANLVEASQLVDDCGIVAADRLREALGLAASLELYSSVVVSAEEQLRRLDSGRQSQVRPCPLSQTRRGRDSSLWHGRRDRSADADAWVGMNAALASPREVELRWHPMALHWTCGEPSKKQR